MKKSLSRYFNRAFGPFRKRHWLHGLAVVALMAAMLFVLYVVGLSMSIFNPLSEAIGGYKLSDGFFYALNLNKENIKPNPDVVIVDLNGLNNRGEIAHIIDEINSRKPAVLALDIIFPKAASVPPAEDSLLVEALKRTEHLVIAKNESAVSDEHSFFAEDICTLRNAKEGNVTIASGMVREFACGPETFIGETLSAFNKAELPISPSLIDFQDISTYTYTYNGEEFLDDEIKDKIVLLGDRHDLRDFHSVPVIKEGSAKLAGIDIFAQALYTALIGQKYSQIGKGVSFIIALIFTYLFCSLFICRIFDSGQSFNGLKSNFLQIIAILFLGFVAFLLFKRGIILQIEWFLIGMGLAGLAAEIFYWILSKTGIDAKG